ncbi:glutamate-rich protein 3 [Cheilinus undulatus]|uniref:glutamate-rich protein 3 n=1 Tax=Cheilinus undulatus TaxID=241271 RepID=UPI001BD4AADB|nr:glutamate-rich protein 3 [Cheilinus undulatus]
MSHLSPGLISAYNSLTDKHLAGYFSNTHIRRHLQRAGLITRSGRIVPDKEYRHKLIQRAHQRHVRECLAQAIFHKVLELERVHQIEIKRKLEEFARREKVHKIKVERSKRYEDDIIRILSPRPPTGARGIRKQHSGPEGEHSESSESPGSSRPNTAPGKMQRPVRLKPIHSNNTTASLRHSSPYRLHKSANENSQPFDCTLNKESRRRFNTMDSSHGISPYCLPVINNFVTPVPPPTKRKERGLKLNPSGTLRGRRLRPTTASSGVDITEDSPMLRSSVHQSRVCVNMVYFGKTVHLSHELTDMRDEVKVFQQHCGGENLCVYKGKLSEGETFQFISRRHRGFPFSLTFFLNGLQVERLSSCCEFKHRKGPRLGGKHGHFGFCSVEGASPCYKCIIAMGMDKMPTPPPKRVKEDRGPEESLLTPQIAPEMRTERTGSCSDFKTKQAQDMETQVKEETAAEEDRAKDDYEEDFEADDEGPAEDSEAKEKKSPSPPPVAERKVTEREASETEDDYTKDEDVKSWSGSSLSGSDHEESDAEATKDSREEEEKAEQPTEINEEKNAPPHEKDEPHPEETPATEAESAAPKDSDIANSAGESTEIDISDTSIPSGTENKQCEDTSAETEEKKTVNESKEEVEQERAKSVQEKLAEAILKVSQCSSEPELSDTSTDDTVESTHKGQELDNKDAEKAVTPTEQQQTIVEETKCVAAAAAAVAVLDREQTSDQTEQETEKGPAENSDANMDEKVKVDEKDEKETSEENKTAGGNDKSEETEVSGVALLPVFEKETAEDNKVEAPEDAAGKSMDPAEKREEIEVKAAGEYDMHPQETGQGAKSIEEDESSVSEPNKRTDDTAAPDNAEAEAMTASETMEMKAEPSEELEAFSCEEAPVADTKTASQQGESENRAAESKTEVTEESGETTAEITANISEDNVKEESFEDIKEEVVSAGEASKDDNQQERGDVGEEQTEKSVLTDDKKDEKSEEGKEEKQTNTDDTTEGEDGEKSQVNVKDQTEDKENKESKEEKEIVNISSEDQAKKASSEEEKDANVEQENKSEKTGQEEDKNEEELVEKVAAAVIMTTAAGIVSETITAADEEKQNEAETTKMEQFEKKTEQSKVTQESTEREVVTYTTVVVEEKSEETKEPEKRGEADLGKDNVKQSDESEDFGDSDVANVALTAVTTALMLNTTEGEEVTKRADGGEGDISEKGEVDAENGEVSTGEERRPQENEGENDGKAAEQMEDKVKTEEESSVVKEITGEDGEAAGRNEEKEIDHVPDNAEDKSGAKQEDNIVEEKDQFGTEESEQKTSGAEIKEESKSDEQKDSEEIKHDENANLSESDHEKKDTKMSNNIKENVSEVMIVSSTDQIQSNTPTAVDSDNATQQLERSAAPSDSITEKHQHAEEDVAVVADAENGDTEEASKPSEEGASVLLKPQPQSEQLAQHNETDDTKESVELVEETPEVLAREDLVTNWVTVHQTSKFFETFVEPLEELKEVTPDEAKEEVTPSTETERSVSPVKMSLNVEQEHTEKDVNESVDKTKEKADTESSPPEKPAQQEKEETKVESFITKAEIGEDDKESKVVQPIRPEEHKERQESMEEDKVQEALMQESTDVSKTEVESIIAAHLSVTSAQPESISENQTEEKTAENAAELTEKPTDRDEEKSHLPSSITEEQHKLSASPEKLTELEPHDIENTQESWEKSQEVTEISDFTESRSDEGSMRQSHHEEMKPSDGNMSTERGELQLIQDIKHTLSKERLSTFSVDETLFGRSSYPLLAAARTESGH